MYYLVNSSPWLNGVYGRPSLSGDRRTATFSVTRTAPSVAGTYSMYAYGRDNPTGGTCTGNSYNFANSGVTSLVVGNASVLATTTTLPIESTTTTSILIRTPVPTTVAPTVTTVAPTVTTVSAGQVGIDSWSMVASPNPVKVGQQFVLTTTISCGRQMSTSASPYYPSMYYLVNSSPRLNGVYGGPSLSGDRRTATFSVTLTAPATKGDFNMYAYGRDNPTGGTCTGNSYNFSNSATTRLTVDATPTVTTVAPTVTTIAPTSLLEGSAGVARAPGTGGVVVNGRVTDLTVTFSDNNSASIKYLNNLIVNIAGNSPAAASKVATGSSSIRVYRNQTVDITGSGYAPNTSVDVWINSTPIKLGSTMSDANGLISETFGISANIDIGNHTITLNGKFADGTKASVSVGIEVVDTPTVTTVAPTVATSTSINLLQSLGGPSTLAPLPTTTTEPEIIYSVQAEKPVSISPEVRSVTVPVSAVQTLFDSISPEDINVARVSMRASDGKWKTVRAVDMKDTNIELTDKSKHIEIQLIIEGKDPIIYNITLNRVAPSSSDNSNLLGALGALLLLVGWLFLNEKRRRQNER